MLLSAGLSNFDRFAVGPMLVALAATFHVSVSTAASAATAYFIAYGVSQPVWGVVSDRYGRVKVVRIALVVAAIGSILSAVAPSILTLSSARALTGAAFGAVVPAAITYIGDTVNIKRRQASLSDLLAVMAVGSAVATAAAGVVADYTSWRVLFGAIAVASVVAVIRSSSVKEARDAANTVAHPAARIGMVLSSPWALLVMLLAFVEGALVLGIFALLPAAIQQQGKSAASAGFLVAVYGMSVLIATRVVKKVASHPLIPLTIGVLALVVGHAAPAVISGVVPLVATATLLGIAWAGLHSSLQAWMTMTVPKARATCIALMTSALFLGSGIGTALGSHLLSGGHTRTMFLLATLTSALLATAAIIGRRKYVPSSE